MDTDSDGRADTARTFTTGLDHPNGVVWHDGSLFVMTATHLVRYDDVDRLALSGQVTHSFGFECTLPLKVSRYQCVLLSMDHHALAGWTLQRDNLQAYELPAVHSGILMFGEER